jgi:hypothetical protein
LIKPSEKGKHLEIQGNPETGKKPWKIAYVVLCLTLLALAAYQLFNLFIRFPIFAPDYRGFVGAVQALDHMQNPYILDNINQYGWIVLPFAYPPHTLYFFWFLQFVYIFQNIWVYYIFLIILLIVSSYILLTLDQKPHYLFLTTLLLTGFISLWWNFTRGNKDILFLFLFAIIFTWLLQKKYWQSSIVMGVTVGFSLFATPFAVLYLVIRRPILDRLAYISLSLSVVVALFLVSYCINPSFLFSYIDSLLGSNSPFIVGNGWNAPIPYCLFNDLLKSISPGNIIPTVIISCIYIGIILFVTWNYYQKHHHDPLKVYSLAMLSVFMILPRIMPYNFIILVVPIYFLFKDCTYRIKSLVLGVISLLPFFVWYLPVLSFDKDKLPLLLGSYVQAYSLILIFVVVILHDHLTSASNEEGHGEKNPDRKNALTE